MATQSADPPSPTDAKAQIPASETVQPAMEGDTKVEATKVNSTNSVFVNSEPIREEQVQNAVKFLSHPRVKGSPVIYRRSFLERKGLTKDEIDEAFRRVPDPTPSTQPAGTNQNEQLKSSSNTQSQAPSQTLQPAAAAPAGVVSNMTLARSRFHWSHALLAVGFLAASGAGTAILFKNVVVPKLKSWVRKVVLEEEEEDIQKKTTSKPTLAEEAAAAAKAASVAAADVARASQEMLNSKTQDKRYFEELMNLLQVQVQEMKSMSNTMRKLEDQNTNHGRNPHVEEDRRVLINSSRQSNANGKVVDLRSGRSSPPPASAEPSVAPHPKSYMEIMAMVQRGERPPNIREINDLPPNPNQPVSNPRIAPRAKPWEVGQTQYSSSNDLQFQEGSNGLNSKLKDNGLNNQNGDSSVPWWQRKNVRITELETDDEASTESSGLLANERAMQRSWVPPQPPPVAMPEAAAAIRQPKKPLIQKEQLADDQLVGHPSDITDELQRITKLSESGAVEANGGSSKLESGEIQVGEEGSP